MLVRVCQEGDWVSMRASRQYVVCYFKHFQNFILEGFFQVLPHEAGGDEKLPEGFIVPANLPVKEASQALKTIIAEIAKPTKVYLPKLNQIQITPRKARLVYIPFEEDHHDFIQPNLNLGLNKRLLTLAKNL